MNLQHFRIVALAIAAGCAKALRLAQQTRDTANSTPHCARIAYVRIQKTGGTSFGQSIGPQMANQSQQTFMGKYHRDFNAALASGADCMVTMLRDPVERFMSEWVMAHGPDRFYMFQSQWDVHKQDFGWLKRLLRNNSMNETTLLEYLHAPQNPTRNRQALYLLGFRRVRCRETCCGACCGACSHTAPYGYPAHAYDWDRDHASLLARAKQRLLELRGFGIADCYVQSMKAVARSLSWDPDSTARLAHTQHRRNQNGPTALNSPASELGHTMMNVRTDPHKSASFPLWRQYVTSDVAEKTRRVNHIDSELVAFAKQQMYENHGIRCNE